MVGDLVAPHGAPGTRPDGLRHPGAVPRSRHRPLPIFTMRPPSGSHLHSPTLSTYYIIYLIYRLYRPIYRLIYSPIPFIYLPSTVGTRRGASASTFQMKKVSRRFPRYADFPQIDEENFGKSLADYTDYADCHPAGIHGINFNLWNPMSVANQICVICVILVICESLRSVTTPNPRE